METRQKCSIIVGIILHFYSFIENGLDMKNTLEGLRFICSLSPIPDCDREDFDLVKDIPGMVEGFINDRNEKIDALRRLAMVYGYELNIRVEHE